MLVAVQIGDSDGRERGETTMSKLNKNKPIKPFVDRTAVVIELNVAKSVVLGMLQVVCR